jgi:hypothetical protein
VQAAAQQLQQLLSGGASECCGLDCAPPKAQEAVLTFVEQVMQATSKQCFSPLSPTSGRFAAAAEKVLRPLLQLNYSSTGGGAAAAAPAAVSAAVSARNQAAGRSSRDPWIVVLEKQLHCLARFTPYLTYHLELLPESMDLLLRHAAHRAPAEVTTSPRHKYPDRNPDLTEIYLRFRELVCLIMTRSR